MDAVMEAKPILDRTSTVPFLVRTFVKSDGGFHRPTLFEEGLAPTSDEYQIHTWRDTTLREIVHTLRSLASATPTSSPTNDATIGDTATVHPELKHPLAKFAFRAVYADASLRGRFSSRDMGTVTARELLGPAGNIESPAPALVSDEVEDSVRDGHEKSVVGKSLDELRFIPGDYLCVSVQLPKHLQQGEMLIRGAAGASGERVPGLGSNGSSWKNAGRPLGSPSFSGPPGGTGRGGGHWRGGVPDTNSGAGRGRGEFGRRREFERERDRGYGEERDRRPPPPRRPRDSPVRAPYAGRDGGRDRRSRSRSLSKSHSRSPARRRYRDD